MGRKRHIETDSILDAAERVVARLGAAGLSIDAVAKEAGVSKSRVVYDHASKRALLEALMDRRITAEHDRIENAVKASAGTIHPELFGRILAAVERPNVTDRAIMVAISAAQPSDEALQDRIKDWTRSDLEAIGKDCERPRAARMAYLALMGFVFNELFDWHHWEDRERAQILEDIRALYSSFSEPEAGA